MRRWLDSIGPAVCCGFFCLAVLPGCGSSERTGKVTGTVIFKGKELPGGTITFLPDSGKAVAATIDPDGKFAANDVPYGTLKIGVRSISKGFAQFAPKDKFKIPEGAPNYGSESQKGTYVDLPAELQDPLQSGITFTMDAPEKRLDLTLPK